MVFFVCDEITSLPKDIGWREPAWPRSDVFEPVAFELLIERTLNDVRQWPPGALDGNTSVTSRQRTSRQPCPIAGSTFGY